MCIRDSFYFVLPSTGIELLHWESGTAAFVSLSVYTCLLYTSRCV